MELKKNQVVVFEDGHKEGYLEARWSEKAQAFYSYNEDGERIYSTTIEEKKSRTKKQFAPSEKTCTVLIHPIGETEKAYQIEEKDGKYIFEDFGDCRFELTEDEFGKLERR